MTYPGKTRKLVDCHQHGVDADNELFIVEGDAACASVCRQRDARTQAVLPMQGKPLNAAKASAARIDANQWFSAVIKALGFAPGVAAARRWEGSDRTLRYRRILLLMDPDADGIHCGALMLLFFQRVLPELLQQGQIWMVRPPLLRLTAGDRGEVAYVGSDQLARQLNDRWQRAGVADIQTLRYRGLASLEASILHQYCLAPQSRRADLMSCADADLAASVFGRR